MARNELTSPIRVEEAEGEGGEEGGGRRWEGGEDEDEEGGEGTVEVCVEG